MADFDLDFTSIVNGETQKEKNGEPEVRTYEPIDEGTYEVLMTCEKGKTKAGDMFINCTFKVRKDIDGQKFGGRLIFDGIYKEKATNQLNQEKIAGILATMTNPKTKFKNYDELIQYINNTTMIVDVYIKKSTDSQYKDRNSIVWNSYKPSVVSPVDGAKREKEIFGFNGSSEESAPTPTKVPTNDFPNNDISADDLPF